MSCIAQEHEIRIHNESGASLAATLSVPPGTKGVVLFAHGSGSSRHSPRNKQIAEALQSRGFATLLLDLLTREEETSEPRRRHLVFDAELLAERLILATHWAARLPSLAWLPLGYFGASTGAAAALIAAASEAERVRAVVSRGGRPDLAEQELEQVRAPTLLIVGGEDAPVLSLNRRAQGRLSCNNRLEVVPGATHLFEEPGALERVAELAVDWFANHLASKPQGLDADRSGDRAMTRDLGRR